MCQFLGNPVWILNEMSLSNRVSLLVETARDVSHGSSGHGR